jgi:hypothetical protein
VKNILRFGLLSTGVWLLALAATAELGTTNRFVGVTMGDALLLGYVLMDSRGKEES